MIFDNFIQGEREEVHRTLGSRWAEAALFVRAGSRMPELVADIGERRIPLWEDQGNMRWLIGRIHSYAYACYGAAELKNHVLKLEADWQKTKKVPENLFYMLPFQAYYETHWNDRKGYGDLAAFAKQIRKELDLDGCIRVQNDEILGPYMATLADCYEEMTEEAYDQREVFAKLLRECASKMLCERRDYASESLSCFLVIYGLLKGIRLGILRWEEYAWLGKQMLLWTEINCFVVQHGVLSLKGVKEEERWEKTFYCMLAWGEYKSLEKERARYGF